jgi:hypothetical protein
MNIGIFTIATGKYKQFVFPLYSSICKNFLVDHKKIFILFTDEPDKMSKDLSSLPIEILLVKIERRGFPLDTLLRYHYFSGVKDIFASLGEKKPDILYYLDADMLVNAKVGDEILPTDNINFIGTAHPGYYNNYTPAYPLGTPETNPNSTAYIPNERERPCYWAGGFNGGKFENFLEMSQEISRRIDNDYSSGIIAVWHDESHLNCYFSERVSEIKTLEPAYCYPENLNLSFERKIIALDKNHAEIRSL